MKKSIFFNDILIFICEGQFFPVIFQLLYIIHQPSSMPFLYSQTFKFQDLNLSNQLLPWLRDYRHFCLFDSNGFTLQNQLTGKETIELMLAVGDRKICQRQENAWEQLKVFLNENKGKWIFGHLTYDLKNEIENLTSSHPDHIAFPSISFFVPEILITIRGDLLKIESNLESPEKIYYELINQKISQSELPQIEFKNRISKEDYLDKAQKILDHIQFGDVYELNFCMEFFAENISIEPNQLYNALNRFSPAPFSCFYRNENQYILSASPERFLSKKNDKVFSQPIKGTIRRGKTDEDDSVLIQKLKNDEKERAENIMIVDLVRNDLSRSCKPGTVKVDELCGVYTFPHVHQMISTISGKLKNEIHIVDIIKNAFPMGSMTGAPKVRAMELIELYEETKRGLYSGTVGYITPDGDFDFNVVIRSLQYNTSSNYLSVITGSAITALSNPENEYEECMLKAKAFMELTKS